MNNTLRMLKEDFESSSGLTPQFSSFAKTFTREFKKLLTQLHCIKIEIDRGHFYLSGFFTHNNQIWYFNIGDVRWDKTVYIRTAESYRDYNGGRNIYIDLTDIDKFKYQIKRIIGEDN